MAVFSHASLSEAAAWKSGQGGFRTVASVPTTALDSNDEQVLLAFFPENPFGNGSYLVGASVTVSDMDNGGTALVYSIGIGDADGVIDTALVSASTKGQTGGTDVLPSGTVDVAGKYLILDVTTGAGTPAAGTVTSCGLVDGGILSRSATVA